MMNLTMLEAQKAEILRRRQEYDKYPESFARMDEKSLDRMFTRIRKNVATQLIPSEEQNREILLRLQETEPDPKNLAPFTEADLDQMFNDFARARHHDTKRGS